MKKYTKPSVEIVELSVKESLSALPAAFKGMGTFGQTGTGIVPKKNVTLLRITSPAKNA